MLLAVLLYLTSIGATFNGILAFPQIQPFTLLIFAISVISWLGWHRRRGWYRTPLDAVLVLWLVVVGISIAANPATARRSLEAVWYLGLYAAVWYLLMDLMAQGFLRRYLSEAFVFSSLLIVLVGLLQTGTMMTTNTDNRPVSLIGNPNALGAYLVVLLPFIIVPALTIKNRLGQWVLGGYALATVVLLIATNSRGAWLGFGASLAMLMFLLLAHHDLLSWQRLKNFWQAQSRWRKIAMIASVGLLIAISSVGILVILQSFSAGGRSAALRTYLWEAALHLFTEKPLTGQGLFTYGYHLARFDSIPPGQPHSHAHNLPLTILAELGLPGLVALLISMAIGLWSWWHIWRTLPPSDRPTWLAGAAAVMGFAVHHLFDTPAMMPVIALLGLLALAITLAPAKPVKIMAHWRQIGHPVGLCLLWGALIIVGLWQVTLYSRYYTVLQTAISEETFADSAAALQPLIDADPLQPAYHLQQGYLYGLAASTGDTNAISQAIAAYAHYLELEPYQATAWSNLAALYWQANDAPNARHAIQQARQLAPDWDVFVRQQQRYTTGITDMPPLAPDSLESVWGANMARFQYLRDVLATQFLPQVGW